ncbi:MAG: hypothetical protein TREMPRED_002004, partial [Tremellales sp. Tagirdzhanova-0007]
MKAEEVELADDALDTFGCDFAADCAALNGGNHDSTRYFPGRVSAKIIEGLSGLHSPADLARLLSDSDWPEYPQAAERLFAFASELRV